MGFRPRFVRSEWGKVYGLQVFGETDWNSISTAASLIAGDPTVYASAVEMISRTRAKFRTEITGETYTVTITNENGTKYAELENAVVDSASSALNAIGRATLSLPADDEKASWIVPWEYEVQVWLGESLFFWGPIVDVQTDGKVLRILVEDLLTYFTVRHFGKSNRTNLLQNPSFESGPDGSWNWARTTYAPGIGVGFASETGTSIVWDGITKEGTAALKMANSDAGTTVDGEGIIGYDVTFQTFEVTAPATRPLEITGSAWYRLDSDFVNANDQGFGLVIAAFPEDWPDQVRAAYPGTWLGIYAEWYDHAGSSIYEDDPTEVWIRAEASLEIPAGATRQIMFALHGVDGTIRWDRCRATANEGLHVVGQDVRAVLNQIVTHAQDPAFGKTDLNIDVTGADVGKKVDFLALYENHEEVWERIRQLTQGEDAIDLGVEFTRTRRYLRPYYPRRGKTIPEAPLEWGKNVNAFSWSFSGHDAGNQVVVLWSEARGSVRDEEADEDLSFFGGKTIEVVKVTPDGYPVEDLSTFAADTLRISKRPEVLQVACMESIEASASDGHGIPTGVARRILGYYSLGDLVPVILPDHWTSPAFTQAEYWRIVSIAVSPAQRAVSLTLNPWTEDF